MAEAINYQITREQLPYYWKAIDRLPGNVQEPYPGFLLAPAGLTASLVVNQATTLARADWSDQQLIVPGKSNHLGPAHLLQDTLIWGNPLKSFVFPGVGRVNYYDFVGPEEARMRGLIGSRLANPSRSSRPVNVDGWSYAMRYDASTFMEQNIDLPGIWEKNFGARSFPDGALQNPVQILLGFQVQEMEP